MFESFPLIFTTQVLKLSYCDHIQICLIFISLTENISTNVFLNTLLFLRSVSSDNGVTTHSCVGHLFSHLKLNYVKRGSNMIQISLYQKLILLIDETLGSW